MNSLGHGYQTLVFGQALAVATNTSRIRDRSVKRAKVRIESELGIIAPPFFARSAVLISLVKLPMGLWVPTNVAALLWIRWHPPNRPCVRI